MLPRACRHRGEPPATLPMTAMAMAPPRAWPHTPGRAIGRRAVVKPASHTATYARAAPTRGGTNAMPVSHAHKGRPTPIRTRHRSPHRAPRASPARTLHPNACRRRARAARPTQHAFARARTERRAACEPGSERIECLVTTPSSRATAACPCTGSLAPSATAPSATMTACDDPWRRSHNSHAALAPSGA